MRGRSRDLANAFRGARAGARRLLRLVGDLLDLGRLACGRLTLRVGEHDLVAQLRQELEAASQQARVREIGLHANRWRGRGQPLPTVVSGHDQA
ncbi:MAG: hypothetical protein IT479_00415 [Xanthomonadales bacterium]|nr:hypothetical protein [Xanthomonadales bacterium]MCC6591716.1 hypothetical protein [Xanthomonadales bacterium]